MSAPRMAVSAKTCASCEEPIPMGVPYEVVFIRGRLKAVHQKCWEKLNNDI